MKRTDRQTERQVHMLSCAFAAKNPESKNSPAQRIPFLNSGLSLKSHVVPSQTLALHNSYYQNKSDFLQKHFQDNTLKTYLPQIPPGKYAAFFHEKTSGGLYGSWGAAEFTNTSGEKLIIGWRTPWSMFNWTYWLFVPMVIYYLCKIIILIIIERLELKYPLRVTILTSTTSPNRPEDLKPAAEWIHQSLEQPN